MLDIQDVINRVVLYKPGADIELLRKAFKYAEDAYDGSYRLSGDPYILHALSVCMILIPLRPDEDILVAALLHGLPMLKDFNRDEVLKSFGKDILFLVEQFHYLRNLVLNVDHSDPEAMRKTLMTMSKDLRVLIIRLADALNNMETLEFVAAAKRRELSMQAYHVYAPLAARLGFYHIKSRLEDLAFRYLHQKEYQHLRFQLDDYIRQQEKVVDHIKLELEDFLKKNKVEATIQGRVKNLYSIYKKMKRKNRTTLDDIHDIFAFRIILPTVFNKKGDELTGHLYTLMGLIHSHWTPLLYRFKDYVAFPKPNGYRSLHTTIIGFIPHAKHQPVEIQIRSETMHQQAEFGIASHWLYDEVKGKKRFVSNRDESSLDGYSMKLKDYILWFNGLDELKSKPEDLTDFKKQKVDFFKNRIFVFTPKGEVHDLPEGSTPVDFAYIVHTDVGHRCKGAKVNGSIVSLDYKLQNGDVVDILTSNQLAPKSQWLSFVKTSGAKTKIKAFLHKSEAGQDLLMYSLPKNQVPMKPTVLKDTPKKPKRLLSAFLPLQKNDSPIVYVSGEKGVPYKISLCCKPVIPDQIVAYVSRGNAVRIHKFDCRLIKKFEEERIIDASWNQPKSKSKGLKSAVFMIQALDRVGFIGDVGNLAAELDINIISFVLKKKVGDLINKELVIEYENKTQLNTILQRLKALKSVITVTVAK